MIPERAISFMRAFKAEYQHNEVDEACDLAISCIERYRCSLIYKIKTHRKEKRHEQKQKAKSKR